MFIIKHKLTQINLKSYIHFFMSNTQQQFDLTDKRVCMLQT